MRLFLTHVLIRARGACLRSDADECQLATGLQLDGALATRMRIETGDPSLNKMMIGGVTQTDSGSSHPRKKWTKAPTLSKVLTVKRFHKMTSVRISSVFKNTEKFQKNSIAKGPKSG